MKLHTHPIAVLQIPSYSLVSLHSLHYFFQMCQNILQVVFVSVFFGFDSLILFIHAFSIVETLILLSRRLLLGKLLYRGAMQLWIFLQTANPSSLQP